MSTLHRDAEVRSRRAEESVPAVSEARDAYAGKLLPDVQLRLFRDTQWGFATRTIARGGPVNELPRADIQLQDLVVHSRGMEFDLADYLSRNRVAGLLLMKRGRIALEHYDLGIDANTRWISMSMAKSVSTTLIGAAIQDKLIGSVEEQLTRYLPELRGTSYDGVSIRHLLQMTSGVHWDDTHTDADSERRRMLELQIGQQPGSIMKYLAAQPRIAAPGSVWNYSTGETHVVGALVRAATGIWCADYLSQKIWSKVGMQSDATWWLEATNGLEVAGSGINATLRDYARFGLFMANGGVAGDEQVLPESWIAEATQPRQVGNARVDYGYMWWPVARPNGSFTDGAFSARGIFGQYIYVNPREQVIVAVLSARSKPKGAEAILDNDFFNSAVTALK
ncbi:serine hydrolase domain-containing protein [Steroidobacter sp.]|uniref:serine hydrolase domain-containing protein n=1 Tax=Steroidobacter sp. TaxID=1978227 RepID=UPI001A5653C9|nr:serine hydrolase [Steroidobacter sp.]MBL8269622.1 serine hydrolase [Steroidobacter sp.]